MSRSVLATPRFLRDSRRWAKRHPDTASDVRSAIADLAENAFQPKLRTHKLHGPLSAYWACSVGHDIRIVFEFIHIDGAEVIQLVTIGTHDEVY